MASTDLPPSTSPDIHVVEATTEENLAQTNANSIEWRGALSLPAYLTREELLGNQDLTRNGGLTVWMLVYQPSGSSTRRVLCGCESIRKKALVAKDGKVEDVVSHGICSVFCKEEMRKRGYAGRMMEEVGKRLEGWQAGEEGSAFSVLYSDIGKQFYKARGWEPMPSAHIALPGREDGIARLPETRPLMAEDLRQLCEDDEKLLRTRLAAIERSATNKDTTYVALLPDVRTLDWHHARETFIANELYTCSPEIKGGISGTEPGKRAWCIFTRVWTNPSEEAGNTLHILRLAVEDEAYSDFDPASAEPAEMQRLRESPAGKQIAALLAAAQREAEAWNMEHVEIWNPTNLTLAAASSLDESAKIVHREKESIASLRWHLGGDGDVVWVCNEKYGWC